LLHTNKSFFYLTDRSLKILKFFFPPSNGNCGSTSQSATYLRRVTEPWDEQIITWNTQPSSTTADQVSVPAPATTTSDFEIDVTNLVRIMNDGQSNYGFLWILQTEQKWRSVFAASSDYSDPAKRPKLVVTYQPMKKYFYLKDHLGNIRVTIDENGDVKGYNDYYPFGLQMPGRSMNTALNYALYKFSGKELDEENGINWYYFGDRLYDPVIGRFTTIDPFLDMYLSLTPYQYAQNNPILFIDVNGDSTRPSNVPGIDYEETEHIDVVAERYKPSLANPLGWFSWYFLGERNYYYVLFGADRSESIKYLFYAIVALIPASKGGKIANASKALIKRESFKISIHALKRMSERNISKRMIKIALRKGKKFWDPKNEVYVYIIEKGFGSGKDLLVGYNHITNTVTTVIRGSNLIKSRFIPVK